MNSDSEWRFVSPMKMFYSVTSANPAIQGFSKTCAYKGLENDYAFELAQKMLNQESVCVEQMRRVDKLANTTLKPVVYNC